MISIKQQSAGIREFGTGRLNIGSGLYAHSLQIRAVKPTAKIIVFIAVKLNHIYRHLTQNLADGLLVFIHKQGHHRYKRRQVFHNRLRLLNTHCPFTLGVKHQPDGIRAQFGRGQRVFRSGNAANFGAYGVHGDCLFKQMSRILYKFKAV